jgi:prophage maintenance system killer protein
MLKDNKEIAIYKSKDGKVSLDVNINKETVWLNQKQIAELFAVNRPAITKHLSNIFKSKELKENSVCSILEHTALDNKKYKTKYYSLDAIISVGYRVNSKQATQFRIWATNILKQYLIKGHVLNEKRLKQLGVEKIKDIKNALSLVMHAIEKRDSNCNETISLLKVIQDYSGALDLLDRYDHGKVKIEKSKLARKKAKKISYKEAINLIEKLKETYRGSKLFAKQKDRSFESSINSVFQTFDRKDLYPSIEEKASNLLYFITKNHSFVDGNKRIAASIFLYFMDKNGLLYKKDGSKVLKNNALVAITLMIAESKSEHKSVIVKILVNLIDKRN